MKNTLKSFWEQVWTSQTDKIVMLNQLNEDFKDKEVAYWKGGMLGTLSVRLMSEKEVKEGKLMLRRILLSDGNTERVVEQLQVLCWTDFGELNFSSEGLQLVESLSQFVSGSNSVFLHCSAGCGRSGVFMGMMLLTEVFKAIQAVNQVKGGSLFPFFSVFQVVFKLRLRRVSMVSSLSQYKMLYKFVEVLLNSQFDWSLV